jgi:hypothetical protein
MKNMKKQIGIVALIASMFMLACSSGAEKMKGQIDVLPAFENLTELKVSHLGKNIRYVPLETTDSSLIGTGSKVILLDDAILITYGMRGESHCFLFDRKTGKFIREIGHKGEDPRGYSEPKAYVHPVTGHIYFHRMPDKLIKYSQGGEFLGEVEMPNGLPSGFYPLLTKDGMLVYEGPAFNADHQSQLYWLDEVKGKTGDVALPVVNHSEKIKPEGIQSISVLGVGSNHIGLLGYNGTIQITFKDDVQALYPFNYPAVWEMEDGFRFHETFSDTIYQVKGLELEPYLVFNLGERRLALEERGKKEGYEDKLAITYVLETKDLIYFQCGKNLYGDFTYYNGVYHKSDGKVVMNEVEEAFTDDLTGFIPFTPMAQGKKGEFVGILTIEQIQEWQEEHPDVKLEGSLASLEGLADDANPVVVIVEP